MQTVFKTGGCRKTPGTRHGGCRPTDPLSCAKIGAVVKKRIGRNPSGQSNHLYIRANFACLSSQKPQEHAQVRGMGYQKCAATRGGCRLHPVWLHLNGIAPPRAGQPQKGVRDSCVAHGAHHNPHPTAGTMGRAPAQGGCCIQVPHPVLYPQMPTTPSSAPALHGPTCTGGLVVGARPGAPK